MTKRERRRPEWQKPISVEITPEQQARRYAEILAQAQIHANDLVLTYNVDQKIWPLRLGVVRDDIASEGMDVQAVIDLTHRRYLASNGDTIEQFASPLQFNVNDVFKSLLTFRTVDGDDVKQPKFQIVFGNEAIATWFQLSQQEGLPAVKPEAYIQMARDLGFKPILIDRRWYGDETDFRLRLEAYNDDR